MNKEQKKRMNEKFAKAGSEALHIGSVVKSLPLDTDGCNNDRSKCSCKDWGGCPVD